jgi:hypothetical protein
MRKVACCLLILSFLLGGCAMSSQIGGNGFSFYFKMNDGERNYE